MDELLKLVVQLANIAEEKELTEVRIRDGEIEVQVSRQKSQGPGTGTGHFLPASPTEVTPTPMDSSDANQFPDSELINAPMPSRFYRSPAPEEPAFVQVGDTVNAGDTIAILEVMKTYNPVETSFNCEILDILAEDGDAVEYGQPLFRVRRC